MLNKLYALEKKWRIDIYLFLIFTSGGALKECMQVDTPWWWLILQLFCTVVWVWAIRTEIKKRTRTPTL